MSMPGLQKLPELFGQCTITEDLDGVNVAVEIRPLLDRVAPTMARAIKEADESDSEPNRILAASRGQVYRVHAVSRKRYLTPGNDQQGFAEWVWKNADELVKLGAGRHVGRWWGKGINRGYGLDERRFSLVNYERWSGGGKPGCVHVVPMLYKGPFDTTEIDDVLQELTAHGSWAAPGYSNPLGLIVYHHKLNNMFKVAW